MNYKLKALSIHINGRVYKKEDDFAFNEKNTNPADLKKAVEAGFLEAVDKEEEKKLKEAAELAEAKAKAQKDAIAEAKAEAKAKAKEELKNAKK